MPKKINIQLKKKNINVTLIGRRGVKGERGEQGPQGDPATNLVQSVNGKQGVVVLNPTDVGADSAGSAATAQANAKTYTDTSSSNSLQASKAYTDTEVSSLDAELATVAKTGSYSDLINKPVIPTVPVLSVNGRTGNVVGLAEKAELDMVENELSQDLQDGDVATLSSAKTYTDSGLANKVDKVPGKQLSTEDYTSTEKSKLAGIESGAEVNNISDANATDLTDGGVTTLHYHTVTKSDVGLANVDNTSDANKPISTATQTAINLKADTTYVDEADISAVATALEYTNERNKVELDSRKSPIISPITIFDPGHGFVKSSTAGTQTEDNVDGYKKNNSMVLATAGNGSPVTSRKSITTIDFTGKIPVIAIKVSAVANLSKILIKLSSDGMTSSWYSLNPDPEKFRFLKDNVWIPINLSFSIATIPRYGAVDYSPVVGSPDRSSINTIEVSVQDNSVGPVSVKFGLIGHTDEPARPAVSLTFDDGRISQYTLARKKMDEYGMPGTAYINDASIGDSTHMSISQLREMQDQSGWDISAHTRTHARLTDLNLFQIEQELRLNKEWLINNGFSKGANHLAYPFGQFDYDEVIPMAKKYFASARTVASFPESAKTANPYALRGYYVLNIASLDQMKNAVTRAIQNNEWALFTFHSIVPTPTGVEEDLPQATFDAFIDWLATQDVDVKPVSQVLEVQQPSTDASKLSKAGDVMNANLGLFVPTGVPTHALTLGSTATGIALYNTADQTTNYSRVRQYSNNTANYFLLESGGTEAARPIHLGSNTGTGLQIHASTTANAEPGFIRTIGSYGASNVKAVSFNNIFDASYTTTQTQFALRPEIRHAAAGAYTVLLIDPTETTIGTGSKLLIDAKVNGSHRFSVDSDGKVRINGSDFISGTGAPNGSVAAPVGSQYIDKSMNTGASIWIKKSGTGNTGWQVAEGDTGWRDISSWDATGTVTGQALPTYMTPAPGEVGYIRVRRMNKTVHLAMKSFVLTGEAQIISPVGFRSGGSQYPGIPVVVGSALSRLRVGSTLYIFGSSGQSTTGTYDTTATWSTIESWPTTLPGTAA